MTTTVGSLTVPVPAGAALSEVADPTLLLLLDYLGHHLKAALDAKLAVLTPTSADACPTANRFPWDPETTWVRQGLPALFAWEASARRRPFTMVWDHIVRDIEVLYIFAELHKPNGIRARHGLMSAVGKVMAMAAERDRHATFSYGGSAAGASVSRLGNWDAWVFERGEAVWLDAVPGGSSVAGGSGSERAEQRAYLGYTATFSITERVGHEEPEEVLGDTLLTIRGNEGGTGETVDIMQRYLPGPDGSEQED